ncbi:hypothetical protein AXJ18_gp148 [Streptomyces phage Jay2Jay]|uniref:Uncharacterized protein n=1 Tax=Streptomyces phage Jay2Jay TaxID=1556290 RepID=A0A0A0RKY3_9CAUD|nr:hypothetical protein AXJ18_gp148 [Streptomyces phage Jay2Jay]AIW02626.1 hypothetical protein PBI_JAY2JAY_145 [Streptomyces phage Jay2Jay]
MKVRKMVVYYTDVNQDEEDQLMEAVENILCPNASEEDHECRMHFMSWQTVDDYEE